MRRVPTQTVIKRCGVRKRSEKKIYEAIKESDSHTLIYHETVDLYEADVLENVNENVPFEEQRMTYFEVMSLSDYNRLAKKLNNHSQQVKELAAGEAIYLSPSGRF